MRSLRIPAIVSCLTAAVGLAPTLILFRTGDWLRFNLALTIGLVCSAIGLGIAVWGLRVSGRKGLWLLLPLIPAAAAPLLMLTTTGMCVVSGCD